MGDRSICPFRIACIIFLNLKCNRIVGNAMKAADLIGNRSKIMSAILMAIILVSSMLAFMPLVSAVTPPALTGDYYYDEGVLSTETYLTYPWEDEDLDFGFSKYGEFINPDIPLGLKYKNVDAFASEALSPVSWSNGWVMTIHYVEDAILKSIWAYALFSDREAVEGDWKQKQLSYDGTAVGDEHGGRRTSGYCITDPIRTIYEGPRRAIYLLRTVIYDDNPAAPYYGTAMVRLDIQIVFNKDKKYVLEIKDIKRLERSKWTGPFQIEFSQRGEWDIGTTSVCNSYAEFYNDLDTKYDKHPFYSPYTADGTTDYPIRNEPVKYDLCQMISTEPNIDLVGFWAFWPQLQSKWVDKTYGMPKSKLLKSLETVEESFDGDDIAGYTGPNGEYTLDNDAIYYPRGDGIWSSKPWLFKNGEEMPTADWTWTDPATITFDHAQEADDEFVVLYKKEVLGAIEHPDGPLGTSYGMSDEAPAGAVPYVFGEWDFELSYTNEYHSTHHFRAVSVFGLTDNHDAYDGDVPAGNHALDKIDSEVQFLLDEVFNPWDLNDASHKDTFRWAQKGAIPLGLVIDLDSHHVSHPDYHDITCLDAYHTIVDVADADWGDYGVSAERVIVYDADDELAPKLLSRYDDEYDITGETITFDDADAIAGYEIYKVLYSTTILGTAPDCWDTGRWEWIVVGKDSMAADSAGAAMISIAWEEWKKGQVWLSALDMWGVDQGYRIPYVFDWYSETDPDERSDYYYPDDIDLGLVYDERARAELLDDWSTPDDWDETTEIYPYAITTSNIIIVGGPYANLAAEKYNDFTDAFVFSKYGDGFYSYACWARTSQPSINKVGHEPPPGLGVADDLWYDSIVETDLVGHAIVSTYLDPWGTTAFVVYGYTAEDTYYASYVVRGGLLPWLQELQPGVTTLVLEFDYTTLHPVEIHVAECLGTITECTGFESNFKDDLDFYRVVEAGAAVAALSSEYGLCYKLIDIDWCAELHPDP